jgi:CHAT domain-containing protein
MSRMRAWGWLAAAAMWGLAPQAYAQTDATAAAKKAPAEKVPEHIRVSQQAVAARAAKNYDEAIRLGRRAVALSKRIAGPKASDTADQVWNLGKYHEETSKFAEALALYEEALPIYEGQFGKDHVYIAEVLMATARCHANLNEAPKARDKVQASVAILEKRAPQSAEAKFELGRYLAQGAAIHELVNERELAERMLRRSLAIFVERFGEGHVQVAGLKALLAKLLYERGNYEQALAMQLEIHATYEASYGADHAALAMPLSGAAAALQALGRYAQAQPMFERALELTMKHLGPAHARTASVLHNFCGFSQRRGDIEGAIELCERAVESHRAVNPKGHQLGLTLLLLGGAYHRMGRLDDAEKALRESLRLRRKYWGSDHPIVAQGLEGLAQIALTRGRKDDARQLATEALEIRQVAHGPGHVLATEAMVTLAWTQEAAARLVTMQAVAERRRRAFGAHHPALADALHAIAETQVDLGEHERALATLLELNGIREHNLSLLLGTGTELQKLQAIERLRSEAGLAITLHLSHRPDDAAAATMAYDVVLQRKGRVMDVLAGGLERLRKRATPEDRALVDELSRVRAGLGAMVFGARTEQDDATANTDRAAVAKALDDKLRVLERKVADRSAAYRRLGHRVTLADVQAALAPDAALVDFVFYGPHATDDARPHFRYAAYVVTRDGPPRGVDLGEVPEINRVAIALHDAMARPGSDTRSLGRQLDAAIMAPVRRLLGDRRRLFVSPDQKLSLVPFGALVDEQGRFLIEQTRFSQLSSARELPSLGGVAHEGETVLVGAPSFGAMDAETPRGRGGGMGLVFPELPGAAQEIAQLGELLHRSRTLVGEAASEGALKKLKQPRLLHVATHGFFVGDQGEVAIASTRGVKMVKLKSDVPKHSALLRSGLALAGANHGGTGDGEDGVLTALEAASLDLSGTQLVVLSACETGLGEAHSGNGVVGLRRALHLAGAETQVMSLWKVDDEATRDLMVGYYQRLASGVGRADALREVQLELLKDPKRAHPYFWAGFIVSGNDAPLDLGQTSLVRSPVERPPAARGCGCEMVGSPSVASWWWLGALCVVARRRWA